MSRDYNTKDRLGCIHEIHKNLEAIDDLLNKISQVKTGMVGELELMGGHASQILTSIEMLSELTVHKPWTIVTGEV